MRGFRPVLAIAMSMTVALPLHAAEGRAQTEPPRVRQLVATGVAAPDASASTQDARTLHRELNDVMKKYPPSLGSILRMDPSLMSNPTYLAPYPALQAFLAAHPDVMKNPNYYFDDFGGGYYRDPETSSQRILQDILGGSAGLAVFGTVVAALIWIIRLIVDYRRWNRLAKVQAEAHTKLLDRFTANDELIAYVQSPAGSRFLQSAPIALDPGTRRLGAPVSRILWSAQAGLVVMMAGGALNYVSSRVDVDVQQPLYAIGVVAFAIGIGFLLSAGVSYALSHRLGLFEAPAAPTPRTPEV